MEPVYVFHVRSGTEAKTLFRRLMSQGFAVQRQTRFSMVIVEATDVGDLLGWGDDPETRILKATEGLKKVKRIS